MSFSPSISAAYIPVGASNGNSIISPNISPGVAYYFPTAGILKSWGIACTGFTGTYPPLSTGATGFSYYYLFHNQDGSAASHRYKAGIKISATEGLGGGLPAQTLGITVAAGDFICITYRSGYYDGVEFPDRYTSIQINILFQET